ncbi:MAG: hypothetical protein ACKVT0_15485 [Planctomycetaceae bacterium]
MTYVIDVSLSLIRVLEGAAFFRDERLAGYAANAGFWAAEIRHALDIIAGHDARLAAWRNAVPTSSDQPPVSPADLIQLSKRLKSSATRFFRVCRRHLDRAQVLEIEQLLGIHIEERVRGD